MCREEANELSRATGLPIIVLKHLDEIVPEDESFGDYSPYDVDPAGFVNLIRNAKYVLTDSFHGTVFSIINRKQFVSFYRFEQNDTHSRNSRIDNLLSHLDLLDRIVVNLGNTVDIASTLIDYSAVHHQLDLWREDSWSFLREALS